MASPSPQPHHVRGERVVELRRANGLTQLELAAATGLSISTVYRAEHGDASIGPRTAARLAAALAVDASEIYDGEISLRHVPQPPPASRGRQAADPGSPTPVERQLLERLESLQTSIDRLLRDPGR